MSREPVALARRAGVEVLADRVRVVVISALPGRGAVPLEVHELPWDPDRLAELTLALRARVGRVREVRVAVGLAHLAVAAPVLPPASREVRARMLAVEPDRWFAVPADALVALATGGDGRETLAFAAHADLVERVVAAIEAWAPVTLVEPVPNAFARALRLAHHGAGTFSIDAGDGEHASVAIDAAGAPVAVRRVPAHAEALPSAAATPHPPGAVRVSLAAHGAALASGVPAEEQLLSAGRSTSRQRRRAARLARAGAALAASLLLLAWAADRSRERLLEGLDADVAAATRRAGPALDAQARLAALDAAARAAREARAAGDPLDVLATLAARLPRDVVVQRVAGAEGEWRVEGRARRAAAVVPALDAEPRLSDVRAAGATTRFSEQGETWETFAVTFRVRDGE